MQMETFPRTELLRVSLFLPSLVWLYDILKLQIIRYAVKMCISCKMSALTWKGWEPQSLWMSFNTFRLSVNISLISLSFLLQVRLWVGRWKCFLSLIWSNSDCYVGNVKMSTHRAGRVACDYRQSRLLPEAAITPLICFLHWSHLNFALHVLRDYRTTTACKTHAMQHKTGCFPGRFLETDIMLEDYWGKQNFSFFYTWCSLP